MLLFDEEVCDKMEIKKIGVIGAGQMGSGIAEVAISSGFHVLMRDVTPEALDRGKNRIIGDLKRRVEKGKISPEEREAILKRLSTTTRLEDFRDCELLIEAMGEDSPGVSHLLRNFSDHQRTQSKPGQNSCGG